jgi:stage III sporulation protein AG
MGEWWKKWVEKLSQKNKQTLLFIGLIILVGICMCLLSPRTSKEYAQEEAQSVLNFAQTEESVSYEKELEERLEKILEQIDGAGKVEVMITFKTTHEKVLAEETSVNLQTSEEKDAAGGTRISDKEDSQTKIVLEKGTTPYVVKENMALIEGVLVVAEGGDNAVVQSGIITSVSSLMNVPVHKVTVLKMKSY